jgi:hypothetical protein
MSCCDAWSIDMQRGRLCLEGRRDGLLRPSALRRGVWCAERPASEGGPYNGVLRCVVNRYAGIVVEAGIICAGNGGLVARGGGVH